jgi:hypothetical protein
MVLRASHIAWLAMGLILTPPVIAQTTRTKYGPNPSPQDAGCATRTTTSTYLTPHAAIDVKDTTFCFDPVEAWLTRGATYHPGADITAGQSVTFTSQPGQGLAPYSYSWSSVSAMPSAGSVMVIVDASGSMSGHVAVVADAVNALMAGLAEATYELRLVNFEGNQGPILTASTLPPRSVFLFSDGLGDHFFVPTDPAAPVEFKKSGLPTVDSRSDGLPGPRNMLLHADQLGGYQAALTLTGRKLRVITIRPRVLGFFANAPPSHLHFSVRGARGQTATVDIDEEQIRPPSLTAGPPSESQCVVLIRRVLTDGVLSVSGSVTEVSAIHRPVGGAAITGSLSAADIFPLRI